MLNRIRVQLDMSSHPNKQLQNDWVADGEDAFAFDVLDVLAAPEDPSQDIRDDLDTLHELWREKLQAEFGSSY
jgi:hypothetical protein